MSVEIEIEEQDWRMLAFEMPAVTHGQIVAWYQNGIASSKPQVAYVTRVNARTVTLLTAMNGVKETVRHAEDPRLRGHHEQRENGAWDFTEAHKAAELRLTALEARIHILEQVAANATMLDDPQKQKVAEYRILRQRALEMGIEMKGTPSRLWLERKIREEYASGTSSVTQERVNESG